MRRERPDVVNVVSSTSWTPDEDFDVLLDAVIQYDALAKKSQTTRRTSLRAKKTNDNDNDKNKNKDKKLPILNILITGRGALRESFEKRAKDAKLRHVRFSYAWLPIEEYPEHLAMSDLGVCLHQSSSQLDLPMKIVDMFGVGIPVLARTYPCLVEELVQEKVNGLTFSSSDKLCNCLVTLLNGWDGGTPKLEMLENNVTRDRVDALFSSPSIASLLHSWM